MSCCWRSGEVEDSRVHLEDMESLPTVGRMPGSQSCLPPAPASPNAILNKMRQMHFSTCLSHIHFTFSSYILLGISEIVHGFKAQAKDKIRQREKER